MRASLARLKTRAKLHSPRAYEALKSLLPATRKRKKYLSSRTAEDIFTEIYEENGWLSPESSSGRGSTLAVTAALRAELPRLIDRLGIRSLIDAPCGDFNWMQHTELGIDNYIGADIVPELIDKLNSRYSHGTRIFMRLDLTRDALPSADALFCRDLFLHLSYADIERVKRNFLSSDCKYLITSTYPEVEVHVDVLTGEVRPVNLQRAPFNWPEPIELIVDDADEHMTRRMGVWRRDQLDRV